MNKQKNIGLKASLDKQKGMALVIAMMILPLLLVLGGLLMNSAFLDLKVIDSRVMQNESNMILNGTASAMISDSGSPTLFANAVEGNIVSTSDEFSGASSTVQLLGEMKCHRKMQASGSNFKCKYLQIDFKHAYGRAKSADSKWAENALSIGVEQPIFAE